MLTLIVLTAATVFIVICITFVFVRDADSEEDSTTQTEEDKLSVSIEHTPIINDWAETVVAYIAKELADEKNKCVTYNVRCYEDKLVFGYDLHDDRISVYEGDMFDDSAYYWETWTDEYDIEHQRKKPKDGNENLPHCAEYKEVLAFDFAANHMPNCEYETERNGTLVNERAAMALAFADLIAKILGRFGISARVEETPSVYDNYIPSEMLADKPVYALICQAPKRKRKQKQKDKNMSDNW